MSNLSIFTNFLIILFLFITTTPCSYSNNQTDFESLMAFKKSVYDDPLGALSSWNETMHFCRWNGVTCSKRHPNRVISLSLRSQGLMGSLSPHIGNLSFLRILILQNNTFRGPIPQEVGRLRRLQELDFSNNTFGGDIPTNLSHCTNLYELNLVDNELTGSIIPEIGSLVKLESLGLSKNMFFGSTPPSLSNLTNLVQLALSECGLQGDIPESLVQLRRMRWLFMRGNNLTGFVPFGFFNISTMQVLALGYNQLHGNIPSFTLSNLRSLELVHNRFSGLLPPSLSNLSLIERLNVGFNNIVGNMIDLTSLSALETLTAPTNHLTGNIHTTLSSLTNCSHLELLDLKDNLFTGSLPDSVGNLSSLLYILAIDQNQLSGIIPSSIGNLFGLTILRLYDNNLTGPIPWSIGNLDKLQEIYLGENKLTNEMPSSIGNLTLLNSLLLERNNLFGRIPQSLGNCTNLLSLDLSKNNLNGSIPPEILRLSSISIVLDLSYNILIGTIPSEVGNLKKLVGLDFSYNRLDGIIPNSLSSCVMLERLHLGRNSLRGEIPYSLEALRSLQYLDLSQNNFSGTIPAFLAELPLLLYLNISFNALEGEVPTLGVFHNGTAISLQGNHHLCGGISILNLTSCSSPNSKKKLNLGIILISTVGAICLGLSALWFCVIMHKRRTLQKSVTPAATFMVPGFLRLSYSDLLNATGGFSESNLVGAGRFGSVYKGTIIHDDVEQRDVAVKVLNLNIRGAYKSLASECNALRGIRHRNVLKIMSVCDSIDFQEIDFKALVYEYMANGSLENWLHHNSMEEGRILSIIQRLNIAIDIASGVEYLHSGTDSIVIHGDLKPSNILLDHDMVAHVGDFGLAKIISNISQDLSLAEESSSVAVRGTIGYIAPEYGTNDIISTHGDAYSFGIILLEMLTNIRPTSDSLEEYANLQDFVSNALSNQIIEAIDPFLNQEVSKGDKYLDCIVSILKTGVRCSKVLPRDRLSMAEVVIELKKIRSVFLADRHGRNVAPNQH